MSKQGKRPPVTSKKVGGPGAQARTSPDRGPSSGTKPAAGGRPVAGSKAARAAGKGGPTRPQTARRSPKGRRPPTGKPTVYRQRRFPPPCGWSRQR
jgi:hypothetical protein